MNDEYKRIDRIASVIQAEVARLVQFELRDPHLGLVTITEAKVSPDLSCATIYFTVHDKEKVAETAKALKRASKFLRRQLARNIKLRRTPELKFYYDETLDQGERISRLLDE
jgi:ribosome-binding factor A